ncbi:YihY/virulence factor BrkB family protein [Flindersiella endophytica]
MSVVSAGKQTVTKISDRVRDLTQRARDRWSLFDHLARAGAHYGEVLGSQLAAGVTYFGFLSFFPLIALGFAVVGYVVAYVPGAGDALTNALSEFLPGLVGDGRGQINVEQIASAKAGAGIIGLVGLLYSGIGAISALRTALHGVFNPGVKEEQRNFVVGKAMDLVVLLVVGLVAVVSVSVGSVVTAMTGQLVGWLGLSDVPGSGLVLWLLASAVGIGTSTLAFFITYRLLPKNAGRSRDLLAGALLAAIGFEVLKQIAGLVLGQVTSNALYGAFAVMVALLVWINYTSQLAVLGASWAATASARAAAEGADEAGDADDKPEDKANDQESDRDATGAGTRAAGADRDAAEASTDEASTAGADAAKADAAEAGHGRIPRPRGSGQEADQAQSPHRGRRIGHALGRRIGSVLGRHRRDQSPRHRSRSD